MSFRYGNLYLQRPDKGPIYTEELPLIGDQMFAGKLGLKNFSSIRDADPDAWGVVLFTANLNWNLTSF